MAWAREAILKQFNGGKTVLESPGLSDAVVDNGHSEQSKDDATAGSHHEDGWEVDQNQQWSRHGFRQGRCRLEPEDGEVDCWQGLVGRV